MARLHNKAIDDKSKTEQKIRTDLVAVGYVDVPLTHDVQGAITPGMVNRHPAMIAAVGRVRQVVSPDAGVINKAEETAISQLRETIATERRNAVAI